MKVATESALHGEPGLVVTGRGGEVVKKILFFGSLVGALIAVAAQWPEIQRYMKIRSM